MHLKELEIMNDDPTQVDIVYAKCHDKGDVLQQMADYIAKKFDKSGKIAISVVLCIALRSHLILISFPP